MMALRTVRALVVAAVAAASVAVPFGTATAQELTLRDSVGDVWRSAGEGNAAAGTRPNMDIVRTRFKHNAKHLVVSTKVDYLRRNAGRFDNVFRIRTNHHRRYIATVTAKAGNWRGRHALTTYRTSTVRECDGLSHAIDYQTDTVTAKIPVSCIGNPRWVQFTLYQTGNRGQDKFFLDNPYNSRAMWHGWTPKLTKN